MELIMRRGPEEIAGGDAAWLASHLEMCSECAGYAGDFDETGRLLQTVAITASAWLVSATQMKVRERALSMQEQQSRVVLIAISFCLGAMSSAISAWLWWRFGAWVAERFGLSPAIVQPGIMVFLVLPAVVIAVVMLAFPHPVMEGPLISALAREREGHKQ